ncbi:MAG: hypothetical protein L3K00_07990 [Thermoplasmata archaeon]|nr:hypothetical protein [Thermoplasmata archaeon]
MVVAVVAIVVVATVWAVVVALAPATPSMCANSSAGCFQAGTAGIYPTSRGNLTNVTILGVTGNVPLSAVAIGVEPHLDGAIEPNANWTVGVYQAGTSSARIAVFGLDGGGPLWNTPNGAGLEKGMVFSIFTPPGICMSGGLVFFLGPGPANLPVFLPGQTAHCEISP